MTTTTLRNLSALRNTSVSSASLANLVAAIDLWRERARQRRRLTEMSREMLDDIGVSTSTARAEAGKPFWVA